MKLSTKISASMGSLTVLIAILAAYLLDCTVAETKKYCCFKRRLFPSGWLSSG